MSATTADAGETIARAAAALSRATGCGVTLEDIQFLSGAERRNLVARAVARDDEGSARSVIVKATRSSDYDPGAEDALQASGLVREWVATAYIGETAPGREHGAALLAGDVAAGIMVFEDLGKDLGSLVQPLLKGSAQEAENALASYARALGRLHADTLGCREPHHATYQAIFGARTRWPSGWRVEADAEVVAERLGHAAPAGELALLTSRLREPGPWLSLVHGDPCPDNALLVEGRIRLVDYEWARPAHALLDGIYWRMGFPTCWCAGHTPPDVAARVDAVYRDELGRSLPLALDDAAFRTEQAYVTAAWVFTGLAWRLGQALESDEKWGIWSIRGRLLFYLEQVIDVTTAAGVLAGLGESARAWLASLRGRWPEAAPLGYFPAFSRSAA
jgi:hypothetical protein